jgi:hypothetical protein
MLLIASLIFDIVLSLLVWFFDKGGHANGILPAFAWTTSQLLVGGSSYEIATAWGHAAEVIAHLYGFTVLAAAAGSFGAFFHFRHIERGVK